MVQLHLSRQCNRPELARREAAKIVEKHWVQLHTGAQDRPGSWLALRPPSPEKNEGLAIPLALSVQQAWLPGWES